MHASWVEWPSRGNYRSVKSVVRYLLLPAHDRKAESFWELRITGDELIGPATTRRDAKGCLLVSDYAQNAVLKYKTDGEIIWRLGAESRQVETKSRANTSGVQKTSLLARFDRPHMATPLKDETIVVADTWNNRLQRFSPDGELISWHSGDGGWQAAMESPVEASLGTFKCPVAVDENLAGDLLVTLWGSGNLMLLSSDGTSQPIPVLQSLNKPYDARFFGAGVVVADTGNGRVLVLNKV